MAIGQHATAGNQAAVACTKGGVIVAKDTSAAKKKVSRKEPGGRDQPVDHEYYAKIGRKGGQRPRQLIAKARKAKST